MEKPFAMITASVGRDLEAFCAEIGIELAPIARALNLDLEAFKDFEARIDFDAFCRLMEALSALSKREAFGLDYADYFRTGGTGAIGQGLAAAPTMADFFRFMTTYMTTAVDHRSFEATYERDAVAIEWTYSPLLVRCDQFTDYVLRALVNLMVKVTEGRQRFRLFSLQRETPKNINRFKEAFPGRLVFEQDTNCVVFGAELLDAVNPYGDPVAFEFMRQTCERAAAERKLNKPLDQTLKEDIIERLPLGGISIDEAASRRGMSVRTLQRRLSSIDATFDGLVDDARASLIRALLRDSDESMAAVAEAAGYSDQSAFSRAVVRLFDQTPTQLRTRLRKER